MIIYIAFIVALSAIEIYFMLKGDKPKADKKKIITVYSVLALITLAVGMYHISYPYNSSIAFYIMKLLHFSF